jgi:ABC-type transporter Mla subunit MlaD
VALTAAAVVVAAAVVLLTSAAGGSDGSYTVRAIFDDAANLTSGEEVKAAGAKIGAVGAVTATRKGKAAVSLHIENPGFQDFRTDAHCVILPQSLLGEQYVNCTPTEPHPEEAQLPPPLKRIRHGEGAGEYLLPLSNTSSPVGNDQLQDITHLPQSQALRIILNELGATFAGRGEELHEVIVRANPGLRELNRVLHILADENHLLANLAVESDRALAPLVANREHVAGFIKHGNAVAQATARHLAALEENLKLLPAFIRELGPASERVRRFAQQTQPTFENLAVAAPAVNRLFENIAPFSNSTRKFLISFGKTGQVEGPALKASTQLLDRLQSLGTAAEPFAANLAKLTASLRKTGGIERLMDFIFLGAGSTNGYDALGHFLRGEALASTCVNFKIEPASGCGANFTASEGKSARVARASSSSATGTVMARTLAVLEGKTAAQAIAEFPGAEGLPQSGSGGSTRPAGGASAHTTYYKPGAEAPGASERLLEYLLGS